jgi:hypothetical protein
VQCLAVANDCDDAFAEGGRHCYLCKLQVVSITECEFSLQRDILGAHSARRRSAMFKRKPGEMQVQ